MDATENRQDAFERAWIDLGERMVSAAATLRDLATRSIDTESRDRRIDKAVGVAEGISLWEDLSTGEFSDTNDYAAMWRTFTDKMGARLTMNGYQPGYYQGIHLAMTYQRGYSRTVDAPVVVNPHNR